MMYRANKLWLKCFYGILGEWQYGLPTKIGITK